MSRKRRDVYRGKHTIRFPVTLVVSGLLILLAVAVGLFFYLQRFAVYGKDGVTLAIPGLTEFDDSAPSETPSGPRQPTPVHTVSAELVIAPPDYSSVDLQPGQDLQAVHGTYLSAKQLLSGATGTLRAASEENSALILEMSTPEGDLSWASDNEVAQGYALSGQADLETLVGALKDKGYYLIAEINCCRNTLLGKRNPSISLKNAAGAPYTDALGGWLDPYAIRARSYLLALAEELAAAGFDEILFSGLSFPENSAVVSYAETRAGASTPRAAVSGLAVWLARNMPEGVTCSVMLERSALYGMTDPEKESPQDAALYARLFDRLYLRTSEYDHAYDADKFRSVTGCEPGLRFVPIAPSALSADCSFTDAAAAPEA